MPPARARPNGAGLGQKLAGGDVDLALGNGPIPAGGLVAGQVDLSVVVKEQGGVDTALRQKDGFGPFPCGVFGPYVKVAAMADIGGDHVKPPLVVADHRRKNAPGGRTVLQFQLRTAGQTIADLLPVHHVAAVVHRHPGKVLKTTGHQVIILAHAANTGVGIIAWNNWVAKAHVVFPLQAINICTL